MARDISVDFVTSQTGVGYQFFDNSGLIGSRVTASISHPFGGVYYKAAVTPTTGAIGVYWDCADVDVFASEIFDTNAVAADVISISGDATAADNLETMLDGTGGGTLTASFAGSLSGSVGSVTGSVASVTGAVGSVTGSVGSVTAGVTVAAVSTDAISSAAVSAAAVTKIQDGLLKPTVSGRTLDVSSNGGAGIDWSNIENPSSVVDLSNTSVLADMTKISGDTTAADNFETMLDGTGGQTLSLRRVSIVNPSGPGVYISVSGSDGVSITSSDFLGVSISSPLDHAVMLTPGENFSGIYGNVTGSGKLFNGSLSGSVGSIADNGITTTSITANAINAAAIKADAVTKIQVGVWEAVAAGLTTAGSIGKRIVDYLTGDIFARLGAPSGASIAADIAGVSSGGAAPTVEEIRAELDDNSTKLALLDVAVSTRAEAVGSGDGALSYTVTVKTAGAVAIEGALVRMTRAAESFTLTTNASGVAGSFDLDAGTYTISITRAGYTHTTETVVISASGNHNSTMTSPTITAPASAQKCTVAAYMTGADLVGGTIKFDLEAAPGTKIGGRLVGSRTKVATFTSEGSFEIELPRTDLMVPAGAYYRVTIDRLQIVNHKLRLAAPTYDLSSLIAT